MTNKIQDVQDDLAFMRAMAEGPPLRWEPFGQTYLMAGLVYGAQCLFHWCQFQGWIVLPPLPALIISLGFTVVFLAFLTWMLWRRGRAPILGASNRAVNAAFGGVGATNIVMVALFGLMASRHHSLTIWLIYPAVVFALQGAAWLVAAMIRRRAWMTVIAVGWFGSAIALGLTIDTPAYIAVCGVSLLLWMAVPGALMLRQPKDA